MRLNFERITISTPGCRDRDGGSDDGDPDCSNWLYKIIRDAVAEHPGRLKFTSFGVSDRAVRSWSQRKPDWLPPQNTFEEIHRSRGYKSLPLKAKTMFWKRWAEAALEVKSRNRNPSEIFIAVAASLFAAVPEDIMAKVAA